MVPTLAYSSLQQTAGKGDVNLQFPHARSATHSRDADAMPWRSFRTAAVELKLSRRGA